MKGKDCPQWHSCSAAYCPLDRAGAHMKGDPVCYYLREFYKENAEANFENARVGHIYEEFKTLGPKAIAGSRLIRKEIERSAKTNSRLGKSGQKKTAATETSFEGNGVYGTTSVQGVGKGIPNDQYTRIHPLPAAGNGSYEPRLSGNRNQCASCLAYFSSSTAFDKHRTGKFDDSRRCLNADEMLAQHFNKTSDGFWLAPITPKDRVRLAILRTGTK